MSFPVDNLPVKIRSALPAAGPGGYLLVNCRPGGDFSGEGRSYNGTQERYPAVHRSRWGRVV